MRLMLGFASLGLLVGNLVGLTSESVVASLLPLVLALAGGSLLALFKGAQPSERSGLGAVLAAFSLACLAGTYAGIYVSEHQVLTPHEQRAAPISSIADRKYLRASYLDSIKAIDEQVRTGRLSKDEGYDQLQQLLAKSNSESSHD